MDEQHIPRYLYLIEELLRFSPGREEAVLSDNPDLLDADLLKMMKQRAAAEKDHDTVNRLNILVELLEEKLNPPSRGDREGFMNKDKLNSQFLMEILQAIADNPGNPQVVYRILQRNLAKLDDNLAAWLPTWATARLYEFGFAGSLLSFSNLIAQFPLGNKASNMEIAIAGYETILKVLSRQNDPEIWANIQNNRGNAYSDRVKGDKAENLEIAIAAYQQSLSVCTKAAFPTEWANTQNNLGAVYWKRIKGDKAENLEMAIDAYQKSLSVCTKAVFPTEWADTKRNLGMAYSDRIKGDKAENLEMAIAAYQQALSVYTKVAFPTEWADTQIKLGNAYSNKIKGDRAENLEMAIDAYQKSLSVYTKAAFLTEWANIHINLGNAYSNRIKGDKLDNLQKGNYHKKKGLEIIAPKELEELQFFTDILRATAESNGDPKRVYPLLEANLDKLNDRFADNLLVTITDLPEFSQGEAKEYMVMCIGDLCSLLQEFPLGDKASNMEIVIAVYQEALKVITRDSNPKSWAALQNNLAISYLDRIREDRADNLENAIRHFNLALSVRTKEKFPDDWAATQTNLVNVYRNRVRGNKVENLEKAISCATQALDVYTKEKFPIEWAKLQNNRGAAYNERILGNRAENLEKAISSYRSALSVHTKENFPSDWAATHNNLSNAYLYRIKGDRKENLENTIACATQALKVHTKENYPYQWAIIQNNLGTLYLSRIKGEKEENLEKSIGCLTQALEVHTKEKSPIDWAKLQINLGSAYLNRIKEDKEENLEKAINYFTQALEVYTKEKFPDEWATIQRNIGSAYGYRTRGNRKDNLAQVIHYFTLALEIHTQEDFPIQWARTQYNLGSAYVRLYNIRGSRVENLKNAILHFNQSLEIHTPQAHPIECLSISRNLGDLHFTQGDWGEAINTYEQGITAVELSRSWASTDDRRQEILSDAIAVYANMVQACINNNQSDKAIEYVERSKTRNLVELLATRDIYPRGNIPKTVLNKLKQLRHEIAAEQRSLDIAEQNRSGGIIFDTGEAMGWDSVAWLKDRDRLNQLLQQLDNLITNEIDPVDPSFRATQQVEPISYREIQTLVGDRTAIVEWYITNENFHTFIITHQSQHPLVWSSSAEERQALMEWQDEYLQDYQQNREQWIEKLSERLNRLSEILHIEEIINSLPSNYDQIILIPHRFLHLIPLHTLSLPEGDCLLDRFPRGVRYAPSCQLLQLTQNQERSNFDRLLAIQNPNKNLPYTTVEVGIIQHCFPRADVFVEDAAKKATLVEVKVKDDGTREVIQNSQLTLANCAHFSCHGEFNFESPLDSALLLAGGERLTLGEIFDLDLSQCRLVTLSACETGLTNYKILSDEYVGIPSSFLYAGSPSVVSSLWQVQDVSTAFLMIKFYQNLSSCETVAIALNQAQTWLRNLTKKELQEWISDNQISLDATLNMSLRRRLHKMSVNSKPFQNPFYWAAFCAIGQ